MIKTIYEKPIANILFNSETLKAFSLQSGTRQEVCFYHFCAMILEVLARASRPEKESKDIQVGKEEIKLSLFTDNMILYLENPKESIWG